MQRKRVLLIYPSWSVFVRTDYEILSAEYDVTTYHFRPAEGVVKVFAELARQFLFLILHIWRYDTLFIWFADQHSFLPVLFAKLTQRKSLVVIGGYDVCRIPELGYGVFCSGPRGFAAAWSMKHSTLNLPVSTNVLRKVKAITRRKNAQLVYNCVIKPLRQNLKNPERKFVLTVALIDSKRTYYLKGIDLYVDTAMLLPQITFLIIGLNTDKLSHIYEIFPSNVVAIPPLQHDELAAYYSQSKIYCQLSRSESFGIALAEAILHGCIPVVTHEGGMPELVGDQRYIVRRNPEEIADKIKIMFSEDQITMDSNARRILELFDKKLRADKINSLIKNI
jgi:glycosyltransferase involved in cell wall biosynthesis